MRLTPRAAGPASAGTTYGFPAGVVDQFQIVKAIASPPPPQSMMLMSAASPRSTALLALAAAALCALLL